MTGRKASANKLGEGITSIWACLTRVEAFDVKWNAAGDHYAIMFDRKIVVYDMQATAVLTIQHPVRIHCIRYFQHPVHGETILAGLDDKFIRFYSPSAGKVLQDIKGHRARYSQSLMRLTCRVKAIDASMMSHNGLIRVIASASSDGEVKTWIMADDGTVEESGTYDTGNRLLCLAVHDFAIEQLDTFPRLLKGESDEFESEESDADDEEEEEWHGIDA
jgi:WD40 repeat protein